MRLSWERLRDDQRALFLPSGEPGTHAFHHFHAPTDPVVRERVLAACAVDYETFLVYLEIALQLSTRCMSGAAKLPMKNWKTLAQGAERGDSGFPSSARDQILYLQRTVLYARHKGIVHPHEHISVVSFDNVGNLTFFRVPPKHDNSLLEDLDKLLHEARPEIRSDVTVGKDVRPWLALVLIGSVSSGLQDPELFERLREAFGYALPGPEEVAPAVDAMVDAFLAVLPVTDFARLALAAGPTGDRSETTTPPKVSSLQKPEDPKLVQKIFEKAVKAGRKGRNEDAVAGFARVIQLDPENGTAHFNLALALMSLDQYETAIEHLEAAQAIELPPAEVTPPLIRAHFNAAVAAFNRGDIPPAIANYRRVCELAPGDSEARRHLAVALARGGRIDAALTEAARLDREDQGDADVQLDIGIVLRLAGQVDQAKARFQRALDLRPGWTEAQHQLHNFESRAQTRSQRAEFRPR